MGIIDPGCPEYANLKFRLIREATGLEGSFEYAPRTQEQSEKLSDRLKDFRTVDMRYFYADAPLSVGSHIKRVSNPEQAATIVRVAGLYFPQIRFVEQAFCDFTLGTKALSDHGVYVRNVQEDYSSDAWLKLLSFVAFGAKRFRKKLSDEFKHFPIDSILAQASAKEMVFVDSIDYKTSTAIMDVRNGCL